MKRQIETGKEDFKYKDVVKEIEQLLEKQIPRIKSDGFVIPPPGLPVMSRLSEEVMNIVFVRNQVSLQDRAKFSILPPEDWLNEKYQDFLSKKNITLLHTEASVHGVSVRSTEGKNWGLFAEKNLAKGSTICVVNGFYAYGVPTLSFRSGFPVQKYGLPLFYR